ncbi:MAG: efflux RND transporter permease subunit [Gammaproteobacteria bacterium]
MTDNISRRIDGFAVWLARAVIHHPWRALFVALAITVVAASGMRHLEFANNYRVFFGPGNPELTAFETFQKTYTKNDNLLLVVRPRAGFALGPDTATAVERLTEEAWQIPYANRVDSITNFQHSWADGDDLTVEDLLRDAATLSAADLSTKRDIALAEPLLAGNLVALDGVTTAVAVTLQYPEKDLTEVPRAVNYARELAAGIEADHPDLEVAITGVSALNNAFAEAGQQDATSLIPAMYGLLIVFSFLVLRSLAGVVATVLVIVFSTLVALGVGGHIGWALDPVAATAPVIIMTLAVADSIHILTTLRSLMREGLDKLAALAEAVRINFLAVTITSFTTVVGFMTLNFSDAPPFKHLGTLAAVGIAAAWFFALVLLPAVIRLLPVRVAPASDDRRGLVAALNRVADFVTTHYRGVLLVMGTATLTLIAFVPRIELNDEFVRYFDQRVEFRNDSDFTQEHLRGIYLAEFSIAADEPGGISDPQYLQNLESFVDWLRIQPEVEHVFSYTDIIKRLNRNMHGDDDDWYAIPEDRELAAQYLLLYELSLPYGLDLNDRINIDKSATRVTVTLTDISTAEGRVFYDRATRWLKGNTPESMWTDPTGAFVMFSYISQRNVESMLTGNVIAVIAIALIMMVALRSVRYGALSVIPNAAPILVTLGIWALTVGQVGMPAATVTATSLGIIVDDTVHFLIKYLHALREKHLERPAAIRYAFETVGTAIVATTLILAAGFALLAASTFKINAEMGLLTALAIVVALILDFLLLPAILMIGYRRPDSVEDTDENLVTQIA